MATRIEHHSLASMDNKMLIGLNGDSARIKVLQQNVLMYAVVVKDDVRHEELTPMCSGEDNAWILRLRSA
jgi:hypothetical protein